MSHAYSSFYPAFVAFVTQWFALDGQRDAIHLQKSLAQGYAAAGNWESAINMLGTAIGNCASMTAQIFDADAVSWDQSFFNECLWWAALEPEAGDPSDEYELTAKKICEAWSMNDFEDRAITIAFIDRQRQLIWDETFYVAWAAKPET